MRTLLACLALVAPSIAHAAPIVMGPGVLPQQLGLALPVEYQWLPGTEITVDSGPAISTYGGSHIFDGGFYQGGGSAFVLSQGLGALTVNGGEFRGGGVSPAIVTGFKTIPDWTFNGGLFVGANGAPALRFTPEYPGEVDIFGGEFVGGIDLRKPIDLRFHGTDLVVTPTPVAGIVKGVPSLTVSGLYNDGTPFSTEVITGKRRVFITTGDGFVQVNVPEPSTWAMAAGLFCALSFARRRA